VTQLTIRHDDFFIWWVDNYHQNGRILNELLNTMHAVLMTVPRSDPLDLAKNFRSRLFKYVLMIATTNGVRLVNFTLMKSILGMTQPSLAFLDSKK
jgi:hypothetical protein